MMTWRRLKRLLCPGVVLAHFLTGCQAAAPPPSQSGLGTDFVSLASMAGSATPGSLARAQKPLRDRTSSGMLDLPAGAAGSQESCTARVMAVVNGEPILFEEVDAAAWQALMSPQLTERDKADVRKKKLVELIDREVVLQDAEARLGGRPQTLKELRQYATKQFETQWLHRLMRDNKYDNEKAFKRFLKSTGMPLDMIQRHWERNLLAMEYLRSRLEPYMNKVGHVQVLEHYQTHPDDFKVDDNLVWQDIFILAERHPTREAARKLAEVLVERVRKGEDFVRLAKEYDNGISALGNTAEGTGHKHGEIPLPQIDAVVWGMKAGQVVLVEVGNGYHVVRVKKREHAGRRPFDDKLQKEIKEKLRGEIFQVEMKRFVNGLKRTAVIEIAQDAQ
jgi:parvulin-like peptidyl-prolyl isomerase